MLQVLFSFCACVVDGKKARARKIKETVSVEKKEERLLGTMMELVVGWMLCAVADFSNTRGTGRNWRLSSCVPIYASPFTGHVEFQNIV